MIRCRRLKTKKQRSKIYVAKTNLRTKYQKNYGKLFFKINIENLDSKINDALHNTPLSSICFRSRRFRIENISVNSWSSWSSVYCSTFTKMTYYFHLQVLIINYIAVKLYVVVPSLFVDTFTKNYLYVEVVQISVWFFCID